MARLDSIHAGGFGGGSGFGVGAAICRGADRLTAI
jgi:hypothetical protein